jgi:hypothetical protein
MDHGRLAVYGRPTTRTAWAINPVRRVLCWLVALCFAEWKPAFAWQSRVKRSQLASRGSRAPIDSTQSQSNHLTIFFPVGS